MTFDESGVYARGIGLAHYLVHDDFPGFLHKTSPDDGLVIYDHLYPLLLHLDNPSGDLDFYHWQNMVFALLAFIVLFEMLLWQYQKPWLALLGPLFLFFVPRFLGDIPANPKDMPFAVFYLLALGGIYFFSRNPQISPLAKCLSLGILFGFAQCSRTLGFSLYVVYLLLNCHFYYHENKRLPLSVWAKYLAKNLGVLLLIFMVSSFLMVATWPYLGSNYFKHLWEMLDVSSNFFWTNNVLFLGQQVPSTQLPWTYLFLWLLVTTPIFILFFLVAAIFFVKNKFKNRLFVLLNIAFGVNLALYLLFQPVLYDGLRHFLFLLPILTGMAAVSAIECSLFYKPLRMKKVIAAMVVLNFLSLGSHYACLHPYEYIYFNEFIGGLKGAEGKLDNDYWGASFKEAVEWLKVNIVVDHKRTYKITGSGNSYQIFYYFSGNMKWVDKIQDADYYLSTTRDDKHKRVDPAKKIHVIEREGVPLNYVFKLN